MEYFRESNTRQPAIFKSRKEAAKVVATLNTYRQGNRDKVELRKIKDGWALYTVERWY
jgi:hypothetical protein